MMASRKYKKMMIYSLSLPASIALVVFTPGDFVIKIPRSGSEAK